jgi:hypothetical protein
MKHC